MLIGLHGKKQAGKDTVCDRMALWLGQTGQQPVERVSFADRLYESAAAALGVSPDFLRHWKTDPAAGVTLTPAPTAQAGPSFVSFREYLQRYGTEAHREIFGADFWVSCVDLLNHDDRVVVVTDVRFANEALAVVNAGGYMVRVVGPDGVEKAADGHASESGLPAFLIDRVLNNTRRDDGFASLDEDVRDLVLYLLKERRAK